MIVNGIQSWIYEEEIFSSMTGRILLLFCPQMYVKENQISRCLNTEAMGLGERKKTKNKKLNNNRNIEMGVKLLLTWCLVWCGKAMWWSPDGNRLAYLQFDETAVPQYIVPIYDHVYPTLENLAYPKVSRCTH